MYLVLCILGLLPVTDCTTISVETATPYGRKLCQKGFVGGVAQIIGLGLYTASSWNFTAAYEIKKKSPNCWTQVCDLNMTRCPSSDKETCYCSILGNNERTLTYKMTADDRYQNSTVRFVYRYDFNIGYSNPKKMPNILKKAHESMIVDYEPLALERMRNSCTIHVSYFTFTSIQYCVRNLLQPYRISLTLETSDKTNMWNLTRYSSYCVTTKIQLVRYDPMARMVTLQDTLIFAFKEESFCSRNGFLQCSLTTKTTLPAIEPILSNDEFDIWESFKTFSHLGLASFIVTWLVLVVLYVTFSYGKKRKIVKVTKELKERKKRREVQLANEKKFKTACVAWDYGFVRMSMMTEVDGKRTSSVFDKRLLDVTPEIFH